MSENNKYNVYSVRKYTLHGEEHTQWLKMGVAWEHKNSEGFSLRLTAFPIDGCLTVLPAKKDNE